MKVLKTPFRSALIILALLLPFALFALADDYALPTFGRDTVLVWETKNLDFKSVFVVRIATFYPNRFMEWESNEMQGTVFMSSEDIEKAKGYVNRRLFEGGVDTKSNKATTLWLSRRLYREVKSKGSAKCQLDGVGGAFKYQGQDHLAVEVNKVARKLPVIKVTDGRGTEFWFLDQEGNPLMVKNMRGSYSQTLTIISTDRPNTLRWIKGKKLTNPLD